jgi:hypothetical protein
MGIKVTIQDDPIGTAMYGFACLGISWMVIIFYRTIIAVNSRHTNALETIDDYDEQLKPKLSIRPTFHVHPKFDNGMGTRFVRLIVENISNTILHNCRVREKSFVNVFGHPSNMQRHFRLGEETFADMASHTYKRTFDLQGKGSTEIVEIACLDETVSDSRVTMLYATEPTAQTLNAIIRPCFPHRLTISVTSDDLLVSEERTYDLKIQAGILILEPVE